MKFLTSLIEMIACPFTVLLRNSGNGRNYLANFAKIGFVILVSFIIITALILIFYRDFIFR